MRFYLGRMLALERPLLLLMLVTISFQGLTQDRNAVTELNASTGIGVRDGNLTLSAFRLWSVGKGQGFRIGLGIRYTGYLGENQDFISAPAKITSGMTGPLVIFKQNITENIDTFLIKSALAHCLNLAIDLRERINSRFFLGFNIDLIGGTVGNHPYGNYVNGNYGRRAYARPTAFNILLISDNDRGSLNSEFYVHYNMGPRWALKGGFQFLFTEYTTDEVVQSFPESNDRFRHKSLMLFAGVSYKLSE